MSGTNDSTIIGKDSVKLKAAAFLGKKGLLVVLSDLNFGKTCVIDTHRVVIGRQGDCAFPIADPLLSRTHCAVTIDEKGDFFIEDLESTNATFLNNKKITGKTRLQYGDRILIGKTILRFYLEEEKEMR